MSLPILLDCDEILSDFVGAVLQLAKDEAGIKHRFEDVKGWDMSKELGWPGLNDAVTHAIKHKDLCARLKEIDGAIPWLRDLEETFGADRVFVCTSPWNAEWAGQRAGWLEQRGVPMKRQIQCGAKHLIPGFLVDDAQHHIDKRAPGQGFLIAAPWNSPRDIYPRGDHAAAKAWLHEVAR